MSAHRLCGACGKVCYGGQKEARRAHAAAHYRIRAYYCEAGRTWHVTNGEERHRQFSRGDDFRRSEWRR